MEHSTKLYISNNLNSWGRDLENIPLGRGVPAYVGESVWPCKLRAELHKNFIAFTRAEAYCLMYLG